LRPSFLLDLRVQIPLRDRLLMLVLLEMPRQPIPASAVRVGPSSGFGAFSGQCRWLFAIWRYLHPRRGQAAPLRRMHRPKRLLYPERLPIDRKTPLVFYCGGPN
jgi:hypothetical protein